MMAAKRKKKVEQEVDAASSLGGMQKATTAIVNQVLVGRQESKPGFGSGEFMAQAVPIMGARQLVTVEDLRLGPLHPLPEFEGSLQGAYVRIKPLPGSADEDVERMRAVLLEAGVAAVRVMPVQRAAIMTKETREVPPPRETLRGACMALVETVASQDRGALRAGVERVLGKVGV